MHEMSLISNILAIAEEQARSEGARFINRIEVEVGALAGVEIHSLEFCYNIARSGTMAARGDLVIHEIPGRGWCPGCQQEVGLDFQVAVCKKCGQAITRVLSGRELRVLRINVD